MATLDTFKTLPAGSILLLPEAERLTVLNRIQKLSPVLKNLIESPRTGAYIRGLARNYDLTLDKAQKLALIILRICLGELPLQQLSSILVQELELLSDIAGKMAKEIEQELFSPLMMELNKQVRSQETPKQPMTRQADSGLKNVINLKEKPESTPRLTPQPSVPLLPKRPFAPPPPR